MKYPDTDINREGLCLAWKTALLCIDLQYLNCSDSHGILADVNHGGSGLAGKDIEQYLDRLYNTLIPNVEKLQAFFRDNGHEVIHVRIQSLTRDGRDRSLEHKKLGLHAPPGSRLAEFMPEVAPVGDEIVINKTASGVFVATNLEYILRNLCVSDIFVTGVFTNECISSAVRSAGDLGFRVFLVADATAATTRKLHEATLLTTHDRYARVMTSNAVMEHLAKQAEPLKP